VGENGSLLIELPKLVYNMDRYAFLMK